VPIDLNWPPATRMVVASLEEEPVEIQVDSTRALSLVGGCSFRRSPPPMPPGSALEASSRCSAGSQPAPSLTGATEQVRTCGWSLLGVMSD
jgi:hypothetical protein